MSIEDKIKKMAMSAANEVAEREKSRIEKKSEEDLEVINLILKMVKGGLVYKNIADNHYSKKYAVVTEEMLFEDYTTPMPNRSYNNGTSVKLVASSYYNIEHTQIYVNGRQYYHARDAFKRYEHELEKLVKFSDQEREIVNKKKEALEEMEKFEPLLKKIMLDYDESTKDIKEEA